jgi:hypothetical protein
MRRHPSEQVDCYHTRALEELSEAGGRYAAQGKRTVVTGAQSYPSLPATPLTSPDDHGFAPERDRIEPENATPMTYGQVVSGVQLSGSSDLVASPTNSADDVEPSAPSSASFQEDN